MSYWRYTLDLQDLWALPEEDRDLSAIALEIVRRIHGAPFYEHEYADKTILECICSNFTSFAAQAEAGEFESTEQENLAFNACLSGLYDWGDHGKRVWIATTC